MSIRFLASLCDKTLFSSISFLPFSISKVCSLVRFIDQSFSLEPEGLRKLIRNLNRIPVLLGSANKQLLEKEPT